MLEIVLFLIALILFFAVYFLNNKIKYLKGRLKEMEFQKKSQSVKYGKMSEQFMPFLKEYPYNENNFRFLGTPIDGVQFEDDKIVFVEFKTGDSRLSTLQRKIKDMVEKGKVKFEEIRIS